MIPVRTSVTTFHSSWHRLSVTILGSLLLFQVILSGTALAASASFGVSPGSASVQSGSNVSVTITIAAGSANITAAQACITYDSSKLTLVGSPDYSGSALNSTTPSDPSTDCSAGQVQLGRYGLGVQPTGTFTLGAVTFKAVAASGTASLSFGGSSFVIDDQGDTLSGANGSSTITITAVPSQNTTPTPSGSSGSTTTGGTTSTKTTTKPAATTPTTTDKTTDSTTTPGEASDAAATTSIKTTSATNSKVTDESAPASHTKLYIGIGGLATLLLATAGTLLWFKPGFLKHP